jgi:signal transduction histidine kinase
LTPPRVDGIDRMRELLQAVAVITSDVELPLVLRHILEAAVEVVGAGGGVLTLFSETGDDISESISAGRIPTDRLDGSIHSPIQGRDRLLGDLSLREKHETTEFSAEDAALVAGFAGTAAVAIDNAALRVRLRDLTLLEDRERIAVDLHDTVTQRLFAISLSLQGTVKAISAPEAAKRVSMAVDDLDQTIRQVRSTIFATYEPGLARGDHHL